MYQDQIRLEVNAGIIGRYISKKRKKNERYKIYDSFNRGQVLYPLDKFKLEVRSLTFTKSAIFKSSLVFY